MISIKITIIIIILISIICIYVNQIESYDSFHKLKLVSVNELQMKTGRNYNNCLIKNDQNKVNHINTYLKKNPQKIPKIIHQILRLSNFYFF